MIATTTGWTYPQIDDLTLPEVYELDAYWRKNPPTHILVAAFLGYDADKAQGGDLSDLIQMYGVDNG